MGSSQKYHLVFTRVWKPWSDYDDWRWLTHWDIYDGSDEGESVCHYFQSRFDWPILFSLPHLDSDPNGLKVVTVSSGLLCVTSRNSREWENVPEGQPSLRLVKCRSIWNFKKSTWGTLKLWQTRLSGLMIPRLNFLGLILNIMFGRSNITWPI